MDAAGWPVVVTVPTPPAPTTSSPGVPTAPAPADPQAAPLPRTGVELLAVVLLAVLVLSLGAVLVRLARRPA